MPEQIIWGFVAFLVMLGVALLILAIATLIMALER